MKRFYYSKRVSDSLKAQLEEPVEWAEAVLSDDNFIAEVIKKRNWTYTKLPSAAIANAIAHPKVIAYIDTYRPKWPWSKAIAYTTGNTIYLNSRKLGRGFRSIANTLAHELMHVYNFSHGDNSPAQKEDSIPYWIGSKVETWGKIE